MKIFRIVFCFCTLLFVLNTSAVMMDGGDGSGNTNAPPDDPGWDRVGHISPGYSSVTYLGDKWFITAYHVKRIDNPSAVWLNGSIYDIDSESWTRITNAGGFPFFGADVDLVLFQVTTQPDVLPLRIRSSQIPSNAGVTMIGNGRNRTTNQIYWTSSWVVTNEPNADYSGYTRAAGNAMRWGENQVSSRNYFDDGDGQQYGFQTAFNEGVGSNECISARYDSGGAVFYKNGTDWELAGIMLATGDYYPDQTDEKAVYGNATYLADISYYRDQITNQIVNFDSDIDGLPDWWETEHAGDTTGMSASADSDSDQYTNLQEWYADTDPTNSASYPPEIDDFSVDTNEVSEVWFVGSTNRLYQLHSKTNLMAEGEWEANGNQVWGTGTNSSVVVTNNEDSLFYRLSVTLP